ncbi:CHC2 zinc finger domain-containing protein [Myroides odoratimimus]|uniref:CHC2 zinc finger domain-containing protein n=1 Tax=Myroides odoratimimus TaxID=76832 RepID=UPI002578ADD0|nr:CHC2 zinc finger domain-containing protein [Myroides odoratimimus]MDM1094977.1 toprim domain-containing protein [Myroides odoratimimus]
MNCELAKQISLTDLLKKLGYTPSKTTRIDWWYLSPFRAEKTASFKVNIDKNVFYDHAEGFGGTTLDFVMKYNNCDIKSALELLKNDSFSFHQPIIVSSNIIQEPIYTIQAIKPLTHPNLIRYINDRNLNLKRTQTYCKEVHYTLNNKSYYAVGFQNELDGFELRNKYVKMCLGKKAVTHFDNKSANIVLFESWSDYISFLTLYPAAEKQYDYLIFNSVSMLNNTIIKEFNNSCMQVLKNTKIKECNNYCIQVLKNTKIKECNNYCIQVLKYTKIICCFDNDKAGDFATNKVLLAFDKVIDGRHLYARSKDLNDYLLTINQSDLT